MSRLFLVLSLVLFFAVAVLGVSACVPDDGWYSGNRGGGGTSPTWDDDDATGSDDDDATGSDDDDSTPEGGALDLVIEPSENSNFPTLNVGQSYTITVTLENYGGDAIQGSINLITSDPSGTWTVDTAAYSLVGGTSTDADLTFSPFGPQVYSVDFQVSHNGTGNPSPQTITFTGQGSGAGETNCTDGLDNDSDLLIDCDDPDCAGDPSCNSGTDFCCSSGDTSTWTICLDSLASDCVCAIDPICCSAGGGWDATCVSEYINDCGATTCGS